jgi:L-phenylalanine/L-methionine N-acetyltransferase
MEDNMPDSRLNTKIAGPLPDRAPPLPAGLIIRAREPSDWEEIAALTELPNVRWGTLRLPYTRKDQWRKMMENSSEESTGIVAVLHGRIVGSAGIEQRKGRRRHVGDIGMSVHDDFHRRGIGSALVAALIDVADNWLDLKRLELTVYVDNKAAIRLYEKFDFEVEGTLRSHAFRAGKYVDSFFMARLRPGWCGNDVRAME